jgi:hypothetical protein
MKGHDSLFEIGDGKFDSSKWSDKVRSRGKVVKKTLGLLEHSVLTLPWKYSKI